jgi:flagellar biosynthesis/type III secretory pathway chaperone
MPSATRSPEIAPLRQVLIDEEAACRSLLHTVEEERAAIRTLAITEFQAINTRRLALLESLESLARERDRQVKHLAAQQGLHTVPSIPELLDRLTLADGGDLQAHYHRLMSTAKMVRDEIRQNVLLIDNIRGVVDQALSMGTTVVPGHDLYRQDGHSSKTSPVNVLIHQRG